MPSQYRHRRSSNPANPFPSPLEPGEIAVNTANRQLALGDAAGGSVGAVLPLLAIRFFDARAQYVANDIVIQNGIAYRANGSIAPGAFNASNWTVMADPATFVNVDGDTMTGHLSLPTAPAAANAVRKDYVDTADALKVAKAGDTMTGFLTLHADPDAAMKAVTKQYVDNTAKVAGNITFTPVGGIAAINVQTAIAEVDSEKVAKTGDTMTGHLALPTAPAAANAVRRDYVDAAVPNANVLINADFRVNQGGYVSAAVLAAGAYGHDQWKAGAAGGDYSFTQLKSSTQVTIAAGKSLIQPIEDANVVGGSYVLSWTGTAQARAGVNTLTPSGTYAVSPLLIAGQTAGTVMSVEFNAGTLNTVKLERGSTQTPFVMQPFDQELAACKRYWNKIGGTAALEIVVEGNQAAAGLCVSSNMIFPAEMRAKPTAAFVGAWTFANVSANNTYTGTKNMNVRLTATAAGNVIGYTTDATCFITLDARL